MAIHIIQELLEKLKDCSTCELKWEKHSTTVSNPNENTGICRAYGDRLIPGELQYDPVKKKSMCKIPFFNKALNKYDYELLKINNETVRTLYNDNINNENTRLFGKTLCVKENLEKLIYDHIKSRKYNNA